MKIRNGFVSNSSTTSFCIYGINGSDDDDAKITWNDDSGVKSYHNYEIGDNYYIGIPLTSMKDDETFGQFKERVRNTLRKKLEKEIEDKDFGVMEEAWYDG
jgi:hypothetical protein